MDSITDAKITQENPFKICFVCQGNICRSPTAEGIFRHLINERGLQSYFEIDSSGTSAYHIGEAANSKSQQTAKQHGITLHSKARRFESSDLGYFDLLLAMDHQNLSYIRGHASGNKHKAKIGLLRDFDADPEDGEVPDPYYGGIRGFEKVFRIVQRSCQALLDKLEKSVVR